MSKFLVSLPMIGALALALVACASPEAAAPLRPVRPSPTPCVTATPAASDAAPAGSAMATPAGHTTPVSESRGAAPNVSPSDLATREAQLELRNRPVEVPAAEQSNVPALAVCPTPTPVK